MEKRHLLLAAALAFGTRLHAQAAPSCPVQPTSFKAMRNCYRPVLIFAPNARNSSFAAQQALLEQYADDMMDRNLLYVPVLEASTQFDPPLDAPYVLLKQSEMNAIRARFQVAPEDFLVLLAGKDGSEKFRATKPISVLKLDALVDAMPMGGQEKSARSAKPQ